MAVTKKEFKVYTITQYEKEQEWLRLRHRQGWKFVGVNFLSIYTFEKCEPEDVIYQLDYRREELDPDYIQIFKDCGWEYIYRIMGFNYFCKPSSACSEDDGRDAEIFCDDESRLDMLKRIFRGRLVIALVLLFSTVIPQFIINVIRATETKDYAVLMILYYSALLLYMVLFLTFGLRYFKFEQRVRGNEAHYKGKCAALISGTVLILAGAAIMMTLSYAHPRENVYGIDVTDNSVSMGAAYFDGEISEKIKLERGDTLDINFVPMGGNMQITVGIEGEEPIFRRGDGHFINYKCTVDEDGIYTITFIGKHAEGSFNLSVE